MPSISANLSDEMLLVQARQGCRLSFGELYHRHQGKVYRFTLQMTTNPGVAEEVTQEVFLALLTEMQRYDVSRGALLPYLMGTARNLTYKWLRKQQPFLSLDADSEISANTPDGEVNPLSELAAKETTEALRKAIASLPPAYREVVVLCDLEEMDYAQAAQAMGCAIGTVRSRLHRARTLLTEKWQQERRFASSMRCPA